jgi:hypothetical protein
LIYTFIQGDVTNVEKTAKHKERNNEEEPDDDDNATNKERHGSSKFHSEGAKGKLNRVNEKNRTENHGMYCRYN